jgi:hypothetical protein
MIAGPGRGGAGDVDQRRGWEKQTSCRAPCRLERELCIPSGRLENILGPPSPRPMMRKSPRHSRSPRLLICLKHSSEEDNDPLTDDGSAVSVPVSSRPSHPHRSKPQPKTKHHLQTLLSDSDGVDSPTYDGDVESSAAHRGADPQANPRASTLVHHYSSSTSTLSNPHPETILDATTPDLATEPAVPDQVEPAFNPASLNTADIQSFVQKAIVGESWRKYKINPPPSDRPVRIYADGDWIRYLIRPFDLC